MCGYSNLSIFKESIFGDSVYEQFERGFKIIKRIPHHEMVAIGTGGSFLDPNEVPYDTQAKIIEDLNSYRDISYINVESRAEYINKESLENLIRVVNDPYKLSIGIGLESSNDLIRELCVNKCMNLNLFVKSIKLLKSYNISPTAYVTIGKPFINNWTNIMDATESIRFAFKCGADRVVLLSIGIQPNSLIEWLYKHRLYKPIDIWAIVEVLKRLPDEFRQRVLIANPRLPKHLEVRVSECVQTAMEILNEYKGSLDYSFVEAIDMLISPDKEEWYRNLKREIEVNLSIEEQISNSFNYCLEVWKNEYGKIF